MPRPYQVAGLILGGNGSHDPSMVAALQMDLRRLGYLGSGIDGSYGPGTARAVRALQNDLLYNDGTGTDGNAPLAIKDYNNGAVAAATGTVDQPLAACIDAMLADEAFPKVPEAGSSADALAKNAAALQAVSRFTGTTAPTPFMLAIFQQESGCRHFAVPAARDPDGCVIVGLDHNNQQNPDAVTSRGWGLGQYTIFHHPPQPAEVGDFILDPVQNVQKAFTELRTKFDNFVLGPTDTADDRKAELPALRNLRLCKVPEGDPLYLRDCKTCVASVRKLNIAAGSPVYPGSAITYQPTQYYATASYQGVPNRAGFPCDWPYAVRRYNGSGIDSFHYQMRVLLNLATQPGEPS